MGFLPLSVQVVLTLGFDLFIVEGSSIPMQLSEAVFVIATILWLPFHTSLSLVFMTSWRMYFDSRVNIF